jgi:hypothetical protein
MPKDLRSFLAVLPLLATSCNRTAPEQLKAKLALLQACEEMARDGFRPIAASRDARFLGSAGRDDGMP